MRDGMRALLDLVLPVSCGGCAAPGPAWCSRCSASLAAPIRVRPPRCADGLAVYALGAYRDRLRAALLAYKEHGRRDLAAPLGAALGTALLALPPGLRGPATGNGGATNAGGLCLVPVPSRWSAAARRGGQHVALLAERAAATLAAAGVAAAVAPALRMAYGVRDSVGLDRTARRANLAGRVLPRQAGLPPAGMSVLLIDDVITTGTTAGTCTAALLQAGVEVSAVVVLAAADRHAPS